MTNADECIRAYNNLVRDVNIGDIPFKIPKPPPPTEIANFGLSKKKRKFPYHNFKRFKDVERECIEAKEVPYNIRKEYDDFVDTEWERRYNGFWFYNGDNLEYVTGKHYMFLQWWLITVEKDGRNSQSNPHFVDAQRDAFYAWETCYNDPNSFGLCLGTSRRFGKTSFAGGTGFFDTTENTDSMFAIQSKTEVDAKGIFMKIVKSWQRLPEFLKPIDTGETRVQRKLTFSEPKKTSKAGKRKVYFADILDSEIYYASSKEEALDGSYCSFIYIDEAGKTTEINVNTRWNIQRECLARGSKIVGKALMTTTVEDMEKKGGANFKKIWDRSDYNKKDEFTSRTSSGLYRLFIPADYGYMGNHPVTGEAFVDEWGYSKRDAAKAYIEQQIAQLEGGDKIDFRRKYPLYEDDMFLIDSNESPFNISKLYEQRSYNADEEVNRLVRVGDLYWSERDKEVKFSDNKETGRWRIFIMPDVEDRNCYTVIDGQKFPSRRGFRMGIDPVDDKSPTSGAGSDYVSYVAAMPDPKWGNSAPIPACEYQVRTKNPEDMWEDQILTAMFYSCHVNPEMNKGGTSAWFHSRGYDGFTIFNPFDKDAWKKGKKGTPNNSAELRQTLVDMVAIYVSEKVGYLGELDCYADFPFERLIEDLIKFDKNNWTPHDNTVAWMMTLACCRANVNMIHDFNPAETSVIAEMLNPQPLRRSKWEN